MLQATWAGAVALAASLLLSAVLCAPQVPQQTQQTKSQAQLQQQQQQQQQQQVTPKASATVGATGGPLDRSTQRPVVGSAVQQASATATTNSNNDVDETRDNFEGKNPFTDDSLWQIPVLLERDSATRDQLANSASDMQSLASRDQMAGDEASGSAAIGSANSNNNNDDDDDEQLDEPLGSASPTVISASTSHAPAAAADLKTAAGYHHATPHHGYGGHHAGGHHAGDYHHGKYYQYASVPYPYAWEFGYRRGNPYHTIERKEHGKGPHFQTKVKWNDKHAGYGVHVWDYNHDDHYGHHGYGGHHDYGHQSHGHHGYGHH